MVGLIALGQQNIRPTFFDKMVSSSYAKKNRAFFTLFSFFFRVFFSDFLKFFF